MTACPACGATAADGARFCRSCGAALGLDGPAAAGDGPDRSWSPATTGPGGGHEAGLDPTPVVAAPVVLRRDGPARWVLVVLGVLAVAVGGWALFRPGGGAGPSSADGVTDGTLTPSTARPDTDGPAADTDGPAGTDVAAGSGAGIHQQKVVEEGTGPVLGRPVGWSVLLGDPYNVGGGLWRLDLDTGRLVQYPRINGGPVLAVGGHVLLQSDGFSPEATPLRVVTVEDPTTVVATVDPARPSQTGFGASVVPGPDGGVWVHRDRDGVAWQLVRLADGVVIDTVAGEGFGLVPGGGPDVVTSGSDGVFRRDGNGYRLVAPGRPLAVSGSDVLVRSCSLPDQCGLGWIDRDTGQPVSRPVPPDTDGQRWWQDLVPGSDRYLAGAQLSSQFAQLELYDLVTGDELDWDSQSWGGTAASPDGRYLLADDGTLLSFYDADTARWHSVPHPELNNLVAVFVPNG